MAGHPRLTVLGSLNMDISVTVRRLPGPGETVLGTDAVIAPGGKGANQAVAAARLGAAVRMVGCAGDDQFAATARAALAAEGVDAASVREIPHCATGLALITVNAAGENVITVAPGANARAGDAEVAAAVSAPSDLIVASAEIPAAVLGAVLARARAGGPPCLLNLAPASEGSARLLAGGVDWLVVNESEAATLLGQRVRDVGGAGDAGDVRVRGLQDARAAAARLCGLGARHAVVTAGSQGAALAGAAGDMAVPGLGVHSVDSVGAGDAFVAALGVAMAAGVPVAAAVRAACAAGATAVTRRGTQNALPRPAEILAATGVPWPLGATGPGEADG